MPPRSDARWAWFVKARTSNCTAERKSAAAEIALHDDTTEDPLGWLALIRWDLVDELESALRSHSGGATITHLKNELQKLGDQLKKSDWMPPPPRNGQSTMSPFQLYREMAQQ